MQHDRDCEPVVATTVQVEEAQKSLPQACTSIADRFQSTKSRASITDQVTTIDLSPNLVPTSRQLIELVQTIRKAMILAWSVKSADRNNEIHDHINQTQRANNNQGTKEEELESADHSSTIHKPSAVTKTGFSIDSLKRLLKSLEELAVGLYTDVARTVRSLFKGVFFKFRKSTNTQHSEYFVPPPAKPVVDTQKYEYKNNPIEAVACKTNEDDEHETKTTKSTNEICKILVELALEKRREELEKDKKQTDEEYFKNKKLAELRHQLAQLRSLIGGEAVPSVMTQNDFIGPWESISEVKRLVAALEERAIGARNS